LTYRDTYFTSSRKGLSLASTRFRQPKWSNGVNQINLSLNMNNQLVELMKNGFTKDTFREPALTSKRESAVANYENEMKHMKT